MLFFSKETMNYKKINEWFISNKLSLNVKKKTNTTSLTKIEYK